MTSLDELDRELAARYGAYASYYDSPAAPAHVEYYGETPPHLEVDRLLGMYARPESRALDIGCGAGFSTCRVAATVRDAWGIDQDPRLLAAASRRAEEACLANVTFVEGSVTVAEDVARLPEGYFDLAWSQRGPNLNEALMRALTPDGVFVQELVSDFNAYPLKEIFGRRAFAPYHFHDAVVLQHRYAELGLLPVSIKEYFYDEFCRDAAHLETALRHGGYLTEWRVPTPGAYREDRDRAALDLFARYNMTPRGIRVTRQRTVFVFRRAVLNYYPADGYPGP